MTPVRLLLQHMEPFFDFIRSFILSGEHKQADRSKALELVFGLGLARGSLEEVLSGIRIAAGRSLCLIVLGALNLVAAAWCVAACVQ